MLFRSGHLSEVVGVQLNSERQVVIKARPYDLRLIGCLAVQEHLAWSGFPCPTPLTDVTRLGGLAVTAEAAMSGGDLSPEAGAAPFAALLARLIASAPEPSRTPTLAPSPPWTGWDHPGDRLWPDADDEGRDLRRTCPPPKPKPSWPVSARVMSQARPDAAWPPSWPAISSGSMPGRRQRTRSSASWSPRPAPPCWTCTASDPPGPPACRSRSATSPGSPTATTSRRGTAPHPSTPPPATRLGTGCRARGTGRSTGPCT